MVIVYYRSPHVYDFNFDSQFHRNLASVSAAATYWLLVDLRCEVLDEILDISNAIFEDPQTSHLPLLLWSTPHLDRHIVIFKGDDINDLYSQVWARLDEFTEFEPPLTLEELRRFEDQENCYGFRIGSWGQEQPVPVSTGEIWSGLAEQLAEEEEN